MGEQSADEPTPSSQQKLAQLLESDFTPAREHQETQGPDDNPLKRLLQRSRSIEEIDARMASTESAELGLSLADLLAPAAVTESFKAFVISEVRRAHAWQTKVREAVSPDRLGLSRGAGIFDTEQAEQLEAQALRGFGFDLIRNYTVAPGGDTEGLPSLLLKPTVRPSDYVEAVDKLGRWSQDFHAMYGADAFEGLDADAFMEAAPKAEARWEDPLDPWGWSQVIENLNRLRDEHSQED